MEIGWLQKNSKSDINHLSYWENKDQMKIKQKKNWTVELQITSE